MSGRRERRAAGRRKERLRQIIAAFTNGEVLTASARMLSDNTSVTVAVRRGADGMAHVHCERYLPAEWEFTIEEFDRSFDEFEAACAWLQNEFGIDASELANPTTLPRPRRL